MESVRIRVNPAAWFIVFMEGAFDLVIPVRFDTVMLQGCED
jgi:hypothetical protein